MIIQKELEQAIRSFLQDSSLFLIDTKIRPGNRIMVFIDGDHGVTVDDCQALNRHLEQTLNRDAEDFELTVSSAGADRPLKMPRQYKRLLNRTLDVETNDGQKYSGILISCGNDDIGLEVTEKISKKESRKVIHVIPFVNIKNACTILSFKK